MDGIPMGIVFPGLNLFPVGFHLFWLVLFLGFDPLITTAEVWSGNRTTQLVKVSKSAIETVDPDRLSHTILWIQTDDFVSSLDTF